MSSQQPQARRLQYTNAGFMLNIPARFCKELELHKSDLMKLSLKEKQILLEKLEVD